MANGIGQINNPFAGGSNSPSMSVDDVATALSEGSDKAEVKADKSTTKITEADAEAEPKIEAGASNETSDEEVIDLENADETEDNEKAAQQLDDLEDDYLEFPTRKQILKDFPELFKKHPQIEKAIYRSREFSEIFPSIADAKNAKEDLTVLNTFRGELLNGNVGNILKSVKEANPKALSKIADEFMITLNSVDQGAALEVMNQIGKTLINQAFVAGKNTKNQQLEWAAQHLHNFFYNNPEVSPYVRQNNPQQANPEIERLNTERSSFEQTKFTSAVNDITQRVDSVLKASIDKYLDPDEVMTPYIKKSASSEALDQLKSAIGSDKRLQTVLTKLYQDAHNNDYSDSSKGKIRSVILKKAQAILSDTIKKVRADALKGLGTRSRSAGESRDERPVNRGKPATSRNNSSPSNKQEALAKTRGMSTADALSALMGDR